MNNIINEEETKHLMIDLETGGLKIGAPILQLGYAIFTKSSIAETGSVMFEDEGLWEPDTLKFHQIKNLEWLDTWSEAHKKLISTLDKQLKLVFSSLSFDNSLVFSKSTDFDIAMIKYQTGNEVPWHYRNVRDYRTIAAMAKDIEFKAIKPAHDAENDAFNQALHLIEINQKLESLGLGVL